MEIVFQLLIVLSLVLVNGFFVASEFALVALRKTRVQELAAKGNSSAKMILNAVNNLDIYISSTQLGITLASLALGWIGEPAIAHFLEPFFSFLPHGTAFFTAHTLSIIIAFSSITFLHIVLGELAPKSIALQSSEKTSLFIIVPLVVFTKIFKPFIIVLNSTGSAVLKIAGFSAPTERQLVHSEDEINMILSHSATYGAIEREEAELVYRVLKFGDLPINNIMLPRTEIVAFDIGKTIEEVIVKIRKNNLSRYPVYHATIDTIVGFIHIKDIYKALLNKQQNITISESGIIRGIISVPEMKKADEVLLDMRQKQVHMAVVNDEYGGTAGIVTFEDIIESIHGDIFDEFEKPISEIQKQQDGTYLIDGLASIHSIQRRFKLPIRGEGYTTIAGLVFGVLGREPVEGDVLQIGTLRLTVEKLDGRRIKSLRLKESNENNKDKK